MTIKKITPITLAHNPALTVPSKTEFRLEGEIGRRLAAVTEQWVLPAPLANPGMLAMFHERDRLPLIPADLTGTSPCGFTVSICRCARAGICSDGP